MEQKVAALGGRKAPQRDIKGPHLEARTKLVRLMESPFKAFLFLLLEEHHYTNTKLSNIIFFTSFFPRKSVSLGGTFLVTGGGDATMETDEVMNC